MNFSLFPASLISRLHSDGRLEPLSLDRGLFSRATVVLPRERCLFELVETPEGLNSSTALSAAKLRAQTGAPYQNPGYVLCRRGQRFGIWWWDADWAAEQLIAAQFPLNATLLPEPFFYDTEDNGARILKGETGYEAQRWEDGFLVADLWRRQPLTAEAWRDFLKLEPDQPAPELPGLRHPVPIVNSAYRRTIVSMLGTERIVQVGLFAAVILLCSLSAYLAASGFSLHRQAETLRQEAALIRARTPPRPANQANTAQILALKSLVEHPSPLFLLQKAQEILLPFGYKITTFDASRRTITLFLPEEAVAGVDVICAELRASPYFSDARPKLDHVKKKLVIQLDVRGAEMLKTTQGAPTS
jgi:hypothetical protein